MTMSIETFRRTATRMRAGKGRSTRYPADAREWAVQFTEAQLAQRRTLTSVAVQLGVSDMTLRSWMYAASRNPPGKLCEVAVTGQEAPTRALTLTTAQGHAVSGLDLDGAAALLRALG